MSKVDDSKGAMLLSFQAEHVVNSSCAWGMGQTSTGV
jgi:hypothetical protein